MKIRILVRKRRDMQNLEQKKTYKAMGRNLIFLTELTGVIRIDFLSWKEIQSVHDLGSAHIWDIGTSHIEVPGRVSKSAGTRPKGFCEADKEELFAVLSQNPKCCDLCIIDILIFY